MPLVLNSAAVYLLLMIILRLAGRRTLAELSTFDFVLLLIISEAVQNTLIGEDSSLTGALIVVLTLIGLDVLFSLVKQRSGKIERVIQGVPLVIVRQGKPLTDRMDRARVDVEDVLTAARETQGLGAMEEIEYAILEPNGKISIVPRRE